MKYISIQVFHIKDALRPINIPRVLALLRLGLEELGKGESEPTKREFFDAIAEIPPC
jgi:hypothetical protein